MIGANRTLHNAEGTKKSPKALGEQGPRREYFAQISVCGLLNVALRSCHCCAMGRTAGPLPHRKPNKKEPEGSFLFGTPAGNRTRNGPLGGGCYIHLTTEAYFIIPLGNTSSLRSSCHRKRWGEPGMIFYASMRKHILLSRMGIRRRAWNALYFTTFRAKRQLFSRGKFESAPALPRSQFLSKNMIQILDKKNRISIIKLDMIEMICCRNAATGREGI